MVDLQGIMYSHFVESAWKGYCWGFEDSHEGKRMLTKKQLIKEIDKMIKALEQKEGVVRDG